MRRTKSLADGWKHWKPLLVAIGGTAIAVAFVWWLPGILVTSAMQSSPAAPNTTGLAKVPSVTEYITAVTNARQGVLWAIGGLIAIVTLLFTWARHNLDRDANRTTRYTEAIKQLGDESSHSIRVGGIYALERIAQDSERDRQIILDVLCAFLRDRSPGRNRSARVPTAMRSDAAAAATVVGRMSQLSKPANTLDLRNTNLIDANLQGANFTDAILVGANLTGANLFEANLSEADLKGTIFTGADLTFADLTEAYLEKANLSGATLIGAELAGATLAGADFSSAELSEANFIGAIFTEANLAGANLMGANLKNAFLKGAEFNGTTLTQANLSGAYLAGANLAGANLAGANLAGAYTSQADPSQGVSQVLLSKNSLQEAGALGVDSAHGLPIQTRSKAGHRQPISYDI